VKPASFRREAGEDLQARTVYERVLAENANHPRLRELLASGSRSSNSRPHNLAPPADRGAALSERRIVSLPLQRQAAAAAAAAAARALVRMFSRIQNHPKSAISHHSRRMIQWSGSQRR
jgi:hypothetical protein